jgi:2-amino-1-hydroxyethylphosphonate dioxygenase (glycine-forming)
MQEQNNVMGNVDFTVEQIFELYKDFGSHEYAGEKVTQLEHMCQAAQLAAAEGFDDEVVLAAFFHDLGHLLPIHDENESMHGFGVMNHEAVGAAYLRQNGFSDRLCRLVESHVAAKRYLTFKFKEYYDKLSEASIVTLSYQGGPMSAEEAEAFESDTLFPLYLKMRTWDEAAKIEGQPLPDIEMYRQMTKRYLERMHA